MNRCKDCIFWIDMIYKGYAADATGRCTLLSQDPIGPATGPEPMAKVDAWGHVSFMTKPDFGCVQFRHKKLRVLT